MILRRRSALVVLLIVLLCTASAHAHVGNNDVYQTIDAGPYRLFVTIRTPLVIPGVAAVEVRSTGAAVTGVAITPLPLTGEASKHPPTPDAMKRSTTDPQFFTGSLWIMASGSWQVRFAVEGASGPAITSVPVPAVPVSVLRMQRPLGLLLGALGCLLLVGAVGIVIAAAREARLAPGANPAPARRRRALLAGLATLAFCAFAIYLGGRWWNVEAADYAAEVHSSSELRLQLHGPDLALVIGHPDKDADAGWKRLENSDLLADHGHLMHLYAIRWPEMDAVYHLHPVPAGKTAFAETLPSMPPGTYRLFADVVLRSGFPETETATLSIPAGMTGAPLATEDASASPPPLSAGQLGPAYHLPDGYTMAWDRPAELHANAPYKLQFHLLDPHGNPATNMQPYLGMAGHAAFVKTDGTAFAHTHPEGSAAMPAVMLAEQSTGITMGTVNTSPGMQMPTEPVTSTVDFPYGFPSTGRYRIFIQMKHAGVVETGVFDAQVQ